MAPLQKPSDNRPAVDDAVAISEDLLFEFFDFFDHSIDDVYAYIVHRTRVPEIAEDITLKLYFSLLQRQRFFWWRSRINLPELFLMADKAIAGVVRWREAAGGDSYPQDLARSMRGSNQEEKTERAKLILRALKKLPLKEQKTAVILFFLKWSTAKTAGSFGMKQELVEKAFETTLHHFIEQLENEPSFKELSVGVVLKRIHTGGLSEAKKASLRVAILEKFRTAQMSSLRYVMPIAVLLFAVTSAWGSLGVALEHNLSTGGAIRTMAAAEVLLLQQGHEFHETLRSADEKSHAIAAAFAGRDLAHISLDLTRPAIDQELTLEGEVYTLLELMKKQSGISQIIHTLIASLQ